MNNPEQYALQYTDTKLYITQEVDHLFSFCEKKKWTVYSQDYCLTKILYTDNVLIAHTVCLVVIYSRFLYIACAKT